MQLKDSFLFAYLFAYFLFLAALGLRWMRAGFL